MSEPHPIMALLLEQNSFLGQAEQVENDIMPIDDQLNFGPGDAAILASANTPLEQDFVIARAVNAEKYAQEFPDWEERLLNSYVLCQLFSKNDPEIHLGWVSRLKLLPIKTHRYKECRRWMKDGFPESMPQWATDQYRMYTDKLAEQAPGVVPRSINCPNCGSTEVELVVTRRIEYKGRSGKLLRDGNEIYVPVVEPDIEQEHTARLRCTGCDSTATLEDSEWVIPDHSN